jgi:ABC-type glycerol-3-phosphate transport system substrate-binding protein
MEDKVMKMKGVIIFKTLSTIVATLSIGTGLIFGCAASAAETRLKMVAWNYQVDTVKQFIETFEKQNQDIKVDIEFIPSAQYVAKVVLMKNSNTKFDVLYVFDHVLSQWSNWLQPLDNFEGAKALKDAMLPVAIQSMSYKGKLYGLPYFTSYFGLIVNEKMMKEAGIASPPKTYDEWASQAKKIKEKGLAKYPLIWPVKHTGWGGVWVWYAMVASRRGKVLGEDFNVTPKGLEALKWWAQTVSSGLTDPKSVELDPNDSARAFMSGDYYTLLTGNFFAGPQWANKTGDSKIAGAAGLAPLPETGTTVGFARMYAMNGASEHKNEAWRLLRFLGGSTPDGDYPTPKRWVESGTLTWGYNGLEKDSVIENSLKSWNANPEEVAANLANAEHMSAVVPFQSVWYAEWELYANGVLQEILAGRTSPEDGAKSMAARAKALSARYK